MNKKMEYSSSKSGREAGKHEQPNTLCKRNIEIYVRVSRDVFQSRDNGQLDRKFTVKTIGFFIRIRI